MARFAARQIQQAPTKKIERVLLINPYPYYAIGINEATVYPPLGLASIAAYLEKNRFTCQIIDANILQMKPEQVVEKVKEFNPDIIGIYMNVVTAQSGIEISQLVKGFSSVPIIFGGAFVPEKIDKLLLDSKADYFALGEGELTFLELAQGKPTDEVDGLIYMKEGQLVYNKPRELIQNLDEIPFPAFHLLPHLKLYKSRSRKTPVAPIFTSRGCPYKCIFCSSSSKKSPFGNRFRVRSPEHVVDEIERLVKEFGVKQIDILDDNFTLYMDRADKILDLIIQRGIKVAINIQNGVRADRLTFDLVKKMKKAGIYKLGIGIESGNVGVLQSIKKSLDLQAVRNTVKWCREVGIICIGFFMIGFPQDTEETIRETIDFAVELNPSLANFMTVVPLPNTELYDIVQKNGWFTKPTENHGTQSGYYAADFHYQTPYINKEKVLELQKLAYRKFYFRPSKIMDMMRDMRSWNEFKWTVAAAMPLLKNIVHKSS
jgi:radical SAM superfamily enzyme YgiQ (UPF0313 family)